MRILRLSSRTGPVSILAATAALSLAALPGLTPVLAAAPTEISEIAYAGGDDTDFIEIKGAPGTDLCGFVVGSVSRGGSPQTAGHWTTLPAGTAVDDSGTAVVRLPITNSVNSGAAADGSYGSSVFLIDPAGTLVDFDQIGGVVGGRGVTAGTGAAVPEGLRGETATPTGATAPRGRSIFWDGTTWTAGDPTPGALPDATPTPDPTDPTPDPTDPADITAIADIQGTGAASPLDGQTVTTRGVVTAVYPTGGLNGYYIQTEGTGGDEHALDGASHGIFVYSRDTAGQVQTGDFVELTGRVSEYYEQTQLTVAAGGFRPVAEAAAAPKPYAGEFPDGDEARESLEGMLLQPSGPVTVTDNYGTNRYGEVGLVNGTDTLRQPTDVHRPGTPEAQELAAANAERGYVLDDGATVDYTRGATETPVPYLGGDVPVRVGAPAAFTSPVVLGYGFDAWRMQPLTHLTGENAESTLPVTVENTREDAPREVGGDVTVASFNVLNYFVSLGEDESGCRYYADREGNPTTANNCDVRGAYDRASFDRQWPKIVSAINTLDASVVSLEEIENSARFGKDRDAALQDLVTRLNDAAGTEKWAYAESPAQLPENGEDAIRTAFIYQPAEVAPVGDSVLLDDTAFDNARAPLAQAFAPVTDGPDTDDAAGARAQQAAADDDATFVTIANHFKSKGSGSGPGNADSGDGQGASNADRVAQARALVTFADEQEAAHGTERTFLLGDFNAYTEEDPMQVFYEAGYRNIGKEMTEESTYLFGGLTGSLDHVLATEPLFAAATGADIWNINSVESIGLEYSRYNANVTDLYETGPFRSSDHDPLIVGVDLVEDDEAPGEEPSEDPTDGPSDDPTEGPGGDDPSAEPTPSDTPGGDPAPSDEPGDRPTDDGRGDDGTDGGDDGRGDRGDRGQNDSGQGGDDRDDDTAGSGERGSDRDGGSLPRTGSELGGLAIGAALLAIGGLTLLISRRRRG